MKRLRTMTIANLKMTFRARQALFWNLAIPVIILSLLSFALGNTNNFSLTVGVVGSGPVAQQVERVLGGITGVTVKTGNQASELDALKKGDLNAVLVIPAGLPTAQAPLNTSLYYDQTNLSQSSAVVSLVSQVVAGVSQVISHTAPALTVSQKGIAAVSGNYVDFLLPGVVAFSIMTSGVIGVSSRMVNYREQRILKRLRATPLRVWEFVAANVISQLVVVLAQVLVLTGLAVTVFHVHINGSLITVIGLAFLGSIAFLTIGFTISGLAKTVDAAGAISNAVTMPMMFLSGIYFPISGAPEWLKPIIGVLPLTYLANGMRDIMLRGNGLSSLTTDIAVLAATAVVGFGVAARAFRWE